MPSGRHLSAIHGSWTAVRLPLRSRAGFLWRTTVHSAPKSWVSAGEAGASKETFSMVAVPDVARLSTVAPEPLVVPVRHRRAVAVAVSAMELLRPESDLVRILESFAEVDVLVAADDRTDVAGSVSALDPSTVIEDDDAADVPDDVHERVAELALPSLQLHRLGLTPPQVAGAEADLVAAMSELVGFDPEPGVYCLAPADAPADLGRAAAVGAAQRIAQVYGIPLLRYRCLELSLV
jgi:hypothetical protein